VEDTNKIIRAYLAAQAGIIAIVGTRVSARPIKEGFTLPALTFNTVGGKSNPNLYDPVTDDGIVSPTVQFTCWADNPIGARALYEALRRALFGLNMETVTIGVNDHQIKKAIEETIGQDREDVDIPNYFSVITFYGFEILAK